MLGEIADQLVERVVADDRALADHVIDRCGPLAGGLTLRGEQGGEMAVGAGLLHQVTHRTGRKLLGAGKAGGRDQAQQGKTGGGERAISGHEGNSHGTKSVARSL